jgi:hypothetical protein
MVRRWTSGFELNTTNPQSLEWNTDPNGSTSFVRSDTYAGNNATTLIRFTATQEVDTWVYLSIYLYVQTMPGADQNILWVDGAGSPAASPRIHLDNSGVLRLKTSGGSTLDTGSTISTGQWYHFEWKIRTNSGAGYTTESVFYLDGIEDMSGSHAHSNNGFHSLQTSGGTGIFWDDCVLNDESGSFETGFSDHEVIHLHPVTPAGDNAAWTTQGSANNWDNVDEVPPNDDTDFNWTATASAIDDHNIAATPAALASDDDVPCVQIGVRLKTLVIANEFKLRIKASSGGTVEESGAITTTTGWVTHQSATPRTHRLTLYDLPGGSTDPWTKALLDTAQIGYRHTGGFPGISAVWLAASHLPAVVAADRRRVLAQVA